MFICRGDFGADFEALPHETQALFFQMARYIHGGGSWDGDEDGGIGAQMHRLYGVPLEGIDERLQSLVDCRLIKLQGNGCTLYCGDLRDSDGYTWIEELNNNYSHLMPALQAVAKMFVEKEIEQGRTGRKWFKRRLESSDFRGGA